MQRTLNLKIMKRLFIALFAAALTLPISAQYGRSYPGRPVTNYPVHRSPTNDIYYGLRLGAAFSTVNSDDRELDGGSIKTGLNVGVAAGWQLHYSSPVYLESGLYYTEKGGKGTHDNKKFTYNLNYLEVPLLIKYYVPLNGNASLQPFAGGYMALGIAGKIKDYGDRQAYSSFDDNTFQRFDGGLRIGCGLQFDMIYIEGAYEFGLANICDDTFDTSRNRCFYVNCGVNF